MKRTIKLRESELRNLIAESVKGVLNEVGDSNRGQYMLGRLAAKKNQTNYNSYAPEIQREREKMRIGKYADKQANGDFNKNSAFSHGYNDYNHDNQLGRVGDKYNRYKNQDNNPILQTIGELRELFDRMLNLAYSRGNNARVSQSDIKDMFNMSKEIHEYYNNEQSSIVMNKLQDIINGDGFNTGDVVMMDNALDELEKQ